MLPAKATSKASKSLQGNVQMKNSLKITYFAIFLMLLFTLSSANAHAADTVAGNKDAAHVRVVFQVSDDDAKNGT